MRKPDPTFALVAHRATGVNEETTDTDPEFPSRRRNREAVIYFRDASHFLATRKMCFSVHGSYREKCKLDRYARHILEFRAVIHRRHVLFT